VDYYDEYFRTLPLKEKREGDEKRNETKRREGVKNGKKDEEVFEQGPGLILLPHDHWHFHHVKIDQNSHARPSPGHLGMYVMCCDVSLGVTSTHGSAI